MNDGPSIRRWRCTGSNPQPGGIRCPALPAAWFGVVLAVGALCLGNGCASLLWRVDKEQPWSARMEPAVRAGAPATAAVPPDPGYNLYVLTDSKGFDFHSARSFLRTLHKHPRGGKDDHSVGHSWVLLESPDRLVECGHTGEFGIAQRGYYAGVTTLVKEGDPNPIRYLQTTMNDGEYHAGPSTHTPGFVARFPISEDQHRAVYRYVDQYDYTEFSLTSHQCTDFVAGALRLIDIHVSTRMELAMPAQISFGIKKIRLWTDPEFSTLVLGFPDVLEGELRRLVAEGVADDATEWYFE